MSRFKTNKCFNLKVRTYLNYHSFKDELAKYGVDDARTIWKGMVFYLTSDLPFIFVAKSKSPISYGTYNLSLADGNNTYEPIKPTYTYKDGDYTIAYLLGLTSSKIHKGFWINGDDTSYDVMFLPYSVLGRSYKDIVVEIFNKLGTITNTKTFTIGSYMLSKLSEDDIKIATDKGWTIA